MVSGTGALASSSAVGYLAGRCEGHDELGHWRGSHREAVGWINVGIAGHREHPLGSARLASKVVDSSSGRTWYPPLVIEPPCPSGVVLTVDDVEHAPVGDALYEMEAAGFCSAATRFATAELVQVLKVVSDNRSSPPERLTARAVEELIEAALPALEALVEGTRGLAAEVAARLQSPEPLESFLTRWHFTVTQRRQLERLLRRLAALGEEPLTPEALGPARSAREALAALRRAI